ncbi:MAG: DNA polymerase IV [Puia sp.]|nr:DNA polymerase IV [Puia sp.]
MNSSLRTIAHFDLDSFYVSVERLKNPALRGRPIAVGGHSGRGVVASCSYEARRFGVRSAMPVGQARRLCPELLMVKGDMESYSKYSGLVTDIIADGTPLFEKASVDEFYIDLSGMDRFYGCSLFTRELGRKIEKESGLDISYALATNKLLSKVATNECKPHGRLEIPPGSEKEFLAPLPIEKMPMIGNKTAERLRGVGIGTIRVLSQIPPERMIELLGKNGLELSRRANGIDDTPIIPYHEQKSIGTENTFHTDTVDVSFLHRELARMTESIGFELRQHDMLTGCLTVKIRYSDFQTLTKQCTIPYAASDHLLLAKSRELFDKLYDRHLAVRLIGVRFSHLVSGNYQIHLFDDTEEDIRLYQSIDSIKKEFGEGLLVRASGFVPDRWTKRSAPGGNGDSDGNAGPAAPADKERGAGFGRNPVPKAFRFIK